MFPPIFSLGIPSFWFLLNLDQVQKGLTIELLTLTSRTIGLGLIASLITILFSLILSLASRQNKSLFLAFITFPASIGYAIPGTGIRVSELIDLKISNIFFKENLIRVLGKGGKERFVPLGMKAKKNINNYINKQRGLQKIEESSNDILILSKNGKKLTRHMIFTLIKNISKKSGINKKISPHTFRHSFASHLLKNGADLRSIQLILGHENITTTEIYTHLDSKHLLNVMKKYHPRSK